MRYIIILFLFITYISKNLETRELLDKILLVVNNNIITESRLEQYKKLIKARGKLSGRKNLEKLDKQGLLDKKVSEILIMQYAREKKLVNDSEIDNFIAKRRKALGITLGTFKQQLKMSGYSFVDFKKDMKLEKAKSKILETKLRAKITVSDSELNEVFSKKFNEELKIIEYSLQHILLNKEEIKLIPEIKTKLKAGTKFSDLVAEYSRDSYTKNNAGKLGFMKADDLLDGLKQAAKTMSPGDIKYNIKTKLGVHIIRLDEQRTADNPKLKKYQKQIENELFMKKYLRELNLFVQDLKAKAYIKYSS